ncbi:hypothetical protein F5Y05DRAFT_363905 [Hypoxylon sp. FL0543]|nr:hypothetical protein F5Y05DRAFT_363905 [Hypoxylon sp. FL0543]
MSSMLKKTGGLSFKPKVAPRRPGGAASSSQAPSASASTSATPAPAAEDSSQASTPAPTVPPTPAIVPSVESSDEAGDVQKETPNEIPKGTLRRQPEGPSIRVRGASTAQPASTSTTSPATSAVPANEPVLQEVTTPVPAPTEKAPQPTPVRPADEPRRSVSTSVPPTIEPTAQQTPTSGVLSSRTPPINQPTNASSSTPSATPAISPPPPPQKPPTAGAPAPGPPASAQNRAAPPTAPPSPALVSDTIAVSTPADEPPTTAPKKRTYKRKSTTAENGTGSEGSAPKKKRTRKTAATAPTETTEATESSATPSAEGEGEAAPPERRYRRRRRAPTPEDAENQVVDHSKTKMGELTRDLGIGKRFKHADAIEERAREARERFRQKKLEKQKRAMGIAADEDSASRAGTPAEGENGANGRESALARARELGASVGANTQSVGYEVVDGQIIINQQSLVVDRHAAHRNTANLETVEEDEFSHLTTSSSYRRESRKTGPNHWTDDDTEKFYRLLGMFGTDFETIAAMFPEKSRRAVKLKFNREENLRPKRINATVMVRGEKKVDIDLEEYKAHQTEWQESDKIMAEHAKLVNEHNEDLRRLKEERRAQGLFDDEDEQENGDDGQEGDGEKTTTEADITEGADVETNAIGEEVAVEA